ncbi:hypothetical protein [Streptomyces sp. NPDC054975]
MRRVVIDSNVVDTVANTPGAFEALQSASHDGLLDILYTHVTIDELVAIPGIERRGWLVTLLASLGRIVPTGDAVVGVSRLDFCQLGPDDSMAFEGLRSGNVRHSKDALIASTAAVGSCALATNDRRLASRAREQGVEVITAADLLTEFGIPRQGAIPPPK